MLWRIYALANMLAIPIVCVAYKYSNVGGLMEVFDRHRRIHDTRQFKTGQMSLAIFLSTFAGITAAQSPPVASDQTEVAEAIESVIVTARRRAESLQDTPVAITVLSADALQRQQITGTTDSTRSRRHPSSIPTGR